MIDAGGKLQRSSTRGAQAGAAQIEDLLTEAVRFSDARKAYLLVQSHEGFEVHTRIELVDGQAVVTHPDAGQLDPYEAAIVDQVALSPERIEAVTLRSDMPTKAFRMKDEDQSSMWIPIIGPSGGMCLLYMETGVSTADFPGHVVRAIELYAFALGRLFQHGVGESGPVAGLGLVSEWRRDLGDVDPVVLAGVAESLAIEVNDALSAVIAHAGAGLHWLNQKSPKIEKARQSLRKIATSTFSVGGIVAAHRKAQKSGVADAKPADLQVIVADALQSLTTDLSVAKIQCQCEFSSSTLVHANANQVQRAIVSVISIAVEAMAAAEGARILTISSTTEDRFCVLSFSNTGKAIPADARDAIFDPSYTSKQGNRGIKLAIARTITQLHGGSLDIARSTTDFTTMLLKLPAAVPCR
ncbi:sensor histidine kinase [Agrobacterium sp. 16-2014-1-2a]|uniref:histidine kinase n=1 Tax=Agrobacterium tumefaciens TaxID=358 RepID=A0AB36EJ26_AGRTU|nr:hypothetical protein A6U91_21390 [Agrobacterium tumefaciens]